MTPDDKKEFRRIMADIRDKARRLVYLAMDLDEYQISGMLVTIIAQTDLVDERVKQAPDDRDVFDDKKGK